MEELYDAKINFIEFRKNKSTATYSINDNTWPEEACYRLFLTDILPKELDRVLYLDCDIIVDGDVSEMYFSDMDGVSALVVKDAPGHTLFNMPERLGYPAEKGYFNAGMIMINLEYWREHDISSKCYAFLKNNIGNLTFFDQDVLNVILQDSKRFVSFVYNFQESVILKEFYELYDDGLKKEICSRKPKIIHYTTCRKPWLLYAYGRPFYKLWQRYKRRSMWWYLTDKLPKEKPFNYFVKRYFLWPFGIMRIKHEVAEEWKRLNE